MRLGSTTLVLALVAVLICGAYLAVGMDRAHSYIEVEGMPTETYQGYPIAYWKVNVGLEEMVDITVSYYDEDGALVDDTLAYAHVVMQRVNGAVLFDRNIQANPASLYIIDYQTPYTSSPALYKISITCSAEGYEDTTWEGYIFYGPRPG